MAEIPLVYGEPIRIYTHCTNSKERLHIRTLCDFFNDVAEQHTRLEGVDVPMLNRQGLTWMLRRIHIRIPDMPRKEEEVWLRTWCSGVDGLFVNRDYEMSAGERIRAHAHSEWMIIDVEKRRPSRPTPFMVEEAARCTQPAWAYGSLFDKAERRGRIALPEEPPFAAGSFKARFDDIDFNGHVTQASYVQWMMDALPFEFMKTHTLREIDVIYEREIPPSATVEVRCFKVKPSAEEPSCPDGAETADGVPAVSETGLVRFSHWVLNGEAQPHCVARSVWQKD
ncbi:MAG: acyl-ACP thioesterase [Bacteroidales bacterium]|nr:acyl-ACP thioesterase [Bacteroidales bacterium]